MIFLGVVLGKFHVFVGCVPDGVIPLGVGVLNLLIVVFHQVGNQFVPVDQLHFGLGFVLILDGVKGFFPDPEEFVFGWLILQQLIEGMMLDGR